MVKTKRIDPESIVDLIMHLKWKSNNAVHTDGYQTSRINLWRDFLPPALLDALMDKEVGERLQVSLKDGSSVATFNSSDLFDINRNQFDRRFIDGIDTIPRMGRFYPKGILKGVAGVYRSNLLPFRCVGINNGNMSVDFNHPLAVKDLELSVVIGKVGCKTAERGGTSHDWMEILTTGPGMQARWQDQQTDYISDDAFGRDDPRPDAAFYRKPRYVHHIDETAREMVMNTYGRFITDGMNVLDLMSSWQSHIPIRLNLDGLVGFGLNEDELKRNAQLKDFRVHDLNVDPKLPFESDTFDAVVNTVSVEYLVDPLAVFREVNRILRPEGYFVITFSNRWFPTKAIKIWRELHEHERMGLVLEYFLQAGGFKDLQTYSIRGLPRPHDDKYFPEYLLSDPIYAVWGRKE